MQEDAHDRQPEFSIVERKWKIMEVLRERGTVNVSALSGAFQVSMSTIRRDLDRLEREGFLTKAYGGAYLREPLVRERSLTERLTTRSGAKRAIAAVAASMIRNGETIILGSGTTCQCLARSLPADLSCTIVTNDVRLAAELCQPSKITVITTGGQLDKDSAVCYGSIAEQIIARIKRRQGALLSHGVFGGARAHPRPPGDRLV